MRSHILKDINGSRPLAEIIEEIAELVSFTLNGAPCWCQIADGERLGNCPPALTALCIVREACRARYGAPPPPPPPTPAPRRVGGPLHGRWTGHPGHRDPAALSRPASAPLGVRPAHRHSQPLLPGEAYKRPD